MEPENEFNILVVDDDEDILNIIQKDLNAGGFSTFVAKTEAEALALLEVKSFHCAIVDIVLGPNETSGEIIQFLSKQEREGLNLKLPVILTSAHMTDEFGARIRKLGVNIFDTVKKPFRLGDFTKAVNLMPTRNVLVLDDDEDMRNLIELELKKELYQPIPVATVDEAIQVLKDTSMLCAIVDIILADNKSSEGVIAFLRGGTNIKNAGLPLIVTSAHMNQEYAQKIQKKSKMVSFAIPKPVEKGTYLKAVMAIFGGVGRKKSEYFVSGGGVPEEIGKYFVPHFDSEADQKHVSRVKGSEGPPEEEMVTVVKAEEPKKEENLKVKRLAQAVVEDDDKKKFEMNVRIDEGSMKVKHIAPAERQEMQKRVLGGEGVNARDENGDTPLMVYSRYGELEEVKKLHEQGASVLLKSKSGKTALHYCARTGNLPTLAFLLDTGSKVTTRDSEELEPLGEAILGNNPDMVEELIKRGSRLGTRIKGKSYLLVAEQVDNIRIFRMLLENGADVKPRDPQSGQTVDEICKKKGKVEWLAAMKEFRKVKTKA